jgi:hypothetical protein
VKQDEDRARDVNERVHAQHQNAQMRLSELVGVCISSSAGPSIRTYRLTLMDRLKTTLHFQLPSHLFTFLGHPILGGDSYKEYSSPSSPKVQMHLTSLLEYLKRLKKRLGNWNDLVRIVHDHFSQ